MKVHEKIKELRTQHNETQIELANAIHVTRQAVSKWERGAALPDIDNLNAIAEHYHLTLEELMKDDEVKPIKKEKFSLNVNHKEMIIIAIVFFVLGYAARVFHEDWNKEHQINWISVEPHTKQRMQSCEVKTDLISNEFFALKELKLWKLSNNNYEIQIHIDSFTDWVHVGLSVDKEDYILLTDVFEGESVVQAEISDFIIENPYIHLVIQKDDFRFSLKLQEINCYDS